MRRGRKLIGRKLVKKRSSKPKRVSIKWSSMTIKQSASLLSTWLREEGFDPVLVGKACVLAYLDKRDGIDRFDFMLQRFPINEVKKALLKFGFRQVELRTFKSKDCPYMINFPAPPITAGDELIEKFDVLSTKYGKLRILSPTDSVRCRLTTYYRWGDNEAFEDAVKIAIKEKVDMRLIERWSAREWASDRFQKFLKELASKI